MKTIGAFDKNNELIKMYYVKDNEDVLNYMVVTDYLKTDYLKEIRWKSIDSDEYANTKKYYIKDIIKEVK